MDASSVSTSTLAELDFESRNWKRARSEFEKRHENKARLKAFLDQETITGTHVRDYCAKLQSEAEAKYHSSFGGILDKLDTLMKIGDIAIKSAPESVGLAWMGIHMCLKGVSGDFQTFQLFSGACADIIGIMISCRVYGKMYGHQKGPDDFQELHDKVVTEIPSMYENILEFSYQVKKYTEEHTFIRIGKNIFKESSGRFQTLVNNIKDAEKKMRDFADMATNRLMVYYQEQGLQNQSVMVTDIKTMRKAMEEDRRANETILRLFFEKLEEDKRDMRRKTGYEKAKEEFEKNKEALQPAPDQIDLLEENLTSKREKGTCRWIFDLPQYQTWIESRKSEMLWISGAAGYGKSILMSTIIESLRSDRAIADTGIVQFFFCKIGDQATQTSSRILQTILYQLYAGSDTSQSLLEKTNEILSSSLGKVDSDKSKGLSSQKSSDLDLSTVNLTKAILGIAQTIGRDLYMVIDALDECNDRRDEGLLQNLCKIVNKEGPTIKILLSSRPDPDIAEALERVPEVKCEKNNEADIRKHVNAELGKFPGWTASEKAFASDEIAKKAGGQFRYVRIALDFLVKPMVRPYERRIKELPNGLEGSYLKSWKSTDPEYLGLLKTALTWKILAEGDVYVDEVMDAFSGTYSPEHGVQEELEDANIAENQVDIHVSQLRIAGGNFLEVSSASKLINLRHTTVKEFFLPQADGLEDAAAESNQDATGSLQNLQKASMTQEKVAVGDAYCAEDGSRWRVSKKQGHLDIARILVQNLASPIFQKKFLITEETDQKQDSEADLKEVTDSPEFQSRNEEILKGDGSKEPKNMSGSQILDGDQLLRQQEVGQNDMTIDAILPTSQSVEGVSLDGPKGAASDKIKEGEPVESTEQVLSTTTATDANDEQNLFDDLSDDGNYREEEDQIYDWQSPTDQRETVYRYEIKHWAYHIQEAQRLWSYEEQKSNLIWKEIWELVLKFLCDSPKAFAAWQKIEQDDNTSAMYCQPPRKNRPIHIASTFGFTVLLERLLDGGHDVNEFAQSSQQSHNLLPLSMACRKRHFECFRLLLEHGADSNLVWEDQTIPPSHEVIRMSLPTEWLRLLLEHDVKINTKDVYDYTMLHWFAFVGHDPLAFKLLCDAGAIVNAANSRGETPLHYLLYRDDVPIELLSTFIDNGANVNIDDAESQRPLYFLARTDNIEAGRILIQRGADFRDDNSKGETALHAAAGAGKLDFVKLLLEHDESEVKRVDKLGRTPFFHACAGGHEEIAQYLLESFEDVRVRQIHQADTSGRTPFRKAAAKGNVGIMNMLLERQDKVVAVNHKDAKLGQTPLHVAASNGRKEAIEFLLNAGANSAELDNDGRTPLQLCATSWRSLNSEPVEEALLYLLERSPLTKCVSEELIFTAAANGSLRVLEKLLTAGVDPNVRDEYDWTPILLARQYNQSKIVELLSRTSTMAHQLPRTWISNELSITVSDNVVTNKPLPSEDIWTRTITSDRPIPGGVSKYYYEIEIVQFQNENNLQSIVAVGLVDANFDKKRKLPGIPNGGSVSFGWNSRGGFAFRSPVYSGRVYGGGPWGSAGTVVGCAVNFTNNTVFWTKDGKALGTGFDDVRGRLFPAVGVLHDVSFKTNWGGDLKNNPFRWKGYEEWYNDHENDQQ